MWVDGIGEETMREMAVVGRGAMMMNEGKCQSIMGEAKARRCLPLPWNTLTLMFLVFINGVVPYVSELRVKKTIHAVRMRHNQSRFTVYIGNKSVTFASRQPFQICCKHPQVLTAHPTSRDRGSN